MYSIRGNGDGIAQEFSRLVGKSQSIKKVAQSEDVGGVAADTADVDEIADTFENEIADLLVDEPDSESLAADTSSLIENEINDMETYSSSKGSEKKVGNNPLNPRGEYIMSGLGRISAGLRSKGEGFAADVVEATAESIRGDLVKESNRKGDLLNTLNKMATSFSSAGDQFAADMVLATMNKIGN